MSRHRSLSISRINIVTHPHAPAAYLRLMQRAFHSGKSVAIRGTEHLMIGEMWYLDGAKPQAGVRGQLYRFTHIDRKAPWFNVEKNDVASDDELAQINIPENLRPNCEMFDFVFYPKGHAFYLESKNGSRSLSPGLAAKLLKVLFTDASIVSEFGEVEVNVFSDKEQLNKILKIPQLRRLVIEVTRPNADELGKAQEKVFRRLQNLNARKMKVEVLAESKESIVVDEDLQLVAKVAAAGNGKVIGKGYSRDGQQIEESTVDKPWTEAIRYDPNLQTSAEALVTATAHLPGHD
ncbi:DUF4747 family protein [Herbaspirillum rubrisubalbicans]|uniref:DUF4747 domain-containing protein n=1 Tax=Herbaspirillum rubrisubalbicans TaxID=80842 RepID=A0AAD0U3W8_9BURK|nr:DUF4747 family protein [Herbaspirillum rubrisubalbicans]AYR22308.1 DUF4747 domain-containing protein [Herbaspirillum rubrisubalbicans]